MLKFSIAIPVKKINPYIRESIPKLLKPNYPKDKYEILILPNEKPKHIPKYLLDPRIKIIATGKVSPAIKRDIAAKKAKGEILAFIDDDSYPRKDWLASAEKTFNNLPEEFAAVNGPAVTPDKATSVEEMSGAFFEIALGGGAAHRCKDIGRSFEIDDAPSVNLLVKREVFIEVGGFGSEYWPGEDSLFCQKLKDNGYKLWHQNNLIIFHHRRKSIMAHLKQVSGYGKHRGNFFRKGIGCSRKATYLIPSLFLIGNLITAILSITLWFLLFVIYFVIIGINLCLCLRLPIELVIQTSLLTFVSHLTYGFYFIKGFFTKDIISKLR